MKTVLQILLVPLVLLAGSLLYAECPYPADVSVPEGDTATEDEMVAGQKIVKQYMAGMESYLDCIDEEEAELGEDETDEQIVSQVMSTLRSMFGDEVPDPDGAVVTRWASDPFTLGSYSVVPVGASSSDYDVVAEPIEDRIFFAGEATSRAYPGPSRKSPSLL